MKYPYGLMSDQHAHGWSQFSKTGPNGINSRLRIILSEMERCADEVLAAGGDTIVMAGDLFHKRGSIEPEVFNPVHDTIRAILARGVKIVAIPGNHDLASKETTEIGNAMQSLGSLPGFRVETDGMPIDGMDVVMLPWHATVSGLRDQIEDVVNAIGASREETDLIIHAPVNGVLLGIPDHGFDAKELAGFGFRRVFAGHYHNHKEVAPSVWSIGALTHQTYSDIGTKAGFLLVHPDRVDYRASRAPSFVEVTGDTNPDHYLEIVDGNYVRVSSIKLTDREVNKLREQLLNDGAQGVVFFHERVVTVTARTGAVAAATQTLEQSVDAFVDEMKLPDPAITAAVKAKSAEIMREVRSKAPS